MLYSAHTHTHTHTHIYIHTHFIYVFSCSVAQLCLILCGPMHGSIPGFPGLHYLPAFAQLISIESVMPCNHLILNHPLYLLPFIFPSIRVFSKELALCIRRPNIGAAASSSVLPKNIQDFFSMDWLDLLAVQGTLKSLLQHHSSKASILQRLAFFMV